MGTEGLNLLLIGKLGITVGKRVTMEWQDLLPGRAKEPSERERGRGRRGGRAGPKRQGPLCAGPSLFASAVGPRRLVSISQPGGRYGYLGLGVVTVWYWDGTVLILTWPLHCLCRSEG
jgi:hypothetical protein